MRRIQAFRLCVVAALGFCGVAVAQDAVRRTHLRDTARLVELRSGETIVLRCERNGGEEIKAARWIRDCNAAARDVLRRHARDGLLVEAVGRNPLGEPDAAGGLEARFALRASAPED
jgi:hypothetical protein